MEISDKFRKACWSWNSGPIGLESSANEPIGSQWMPIRSLQKTPLCYHFNHVKKDNYDSHMKNLILSQKYTCTVQYILSKYFNSVKKLLKTKISCKLVYSIFLLYSPDLHIVPLTELSAY
jgi:hypothetical protein